MPIMKRFLLPLLTLALIVACSPKTAPAGGTGKAAQDIIILYDIRHCKQPFSVLLGILQKEIVEVILSAIKRFESVFLC